MLSEVGKLDEITQTEQWSRLTQMVNPNLHLKAINSFHIRTHHDTGIIDEDMQVINL